MTPVFARNLLGEALEARAIANTVD